MERLILVVTSRDEVGYGIARELRRRLLDQSAIVEPVYCDSDARERLAAIAFNLVVTQIDISAHENTAIDCGEQLGLGLLKWLQLENRLNVPGILLAPHIDPVLMSSLVSLPRTNLVCECNGFHESLVRAARNSLTGNNETGEEYLKVVITLDAARNSWSYELKGEGFDLLKPGPLEINREDFLDLARRSRNVPLLQSAWQAEFRKVGESIMRQIFLNNVKFYGQFMNALSYVANDMARIKIWFRITSNLHAIALEAIIPDDINEEFWMLKTPIYRRLEEHPCSRAPLFASQGGGGNAKVNCLIIDANTSGLAKDLVDRNSQPVVLQELPNASNECSTIENYLTDNKVKFGLARILRVSKAEVGQHKFSEFLFNILDGDSWDLVHYVGHSFYDELQKKGYLFFPSEKDGDIPEKVEISAIGPHLNRTRLLYVSSCLSSEEQFNASLAQCDIPAAIGFRWDVDDERATEYAIQFYCELFDCKEKSLLHAFAKTRKFIHDKYIDDRIWAAAVLMVQSS